MEVYRLYFVNLSYTKAARNKNGNNFTETRMKIKLKYYFFTFFCGITFQLAGQHNTTIDTVAQQMSFYLDFKPNWTHQNKVQLKFVKSFNETSLPFFCKVEHSIEKESKIQFRFRLGELNYVNMLENK